MKKLTSLIAVALIPFAGFCWPHNAVIIGEATNGNVVVFQDGTLRDTGVDSTNIATSTGLSLKANATGDNLDPTFAANAGVATTASVAQVAADLATETNRAVQEEALKADKGKERSVSYLIIGDSQAVGTPDDQWSGSYLTVLDNAYLYNEFSGYIGGLKAISVGTGGSELSTARYLLTNNYDRVYVSKAANGGTLLTTHFDPDTGNMYPRITNAVMGVYTNWGRMPDAVVQILGQNDLPMSNAWISAQAQIKLINRTRADLNDPKLPWIIVMPAFRYNVAAAEAGCDLDEVYYIDTRDMWTNALYCGAVHYNTNGLSELGLRIGEKIKEIKEGRKAKVQSVSPYLQVIDCDFENGVVNKLSGYAATDIGGGSGLRWLDEKHGMIYDASTQSNCFYFANGTNILAGDFSIVFDYSTTNAYGTRSDFPSLVGTHASASSLNGVSLFQAWNGDNVMRLVDVGTPVADIYTIPHISQFDRFVWIYDSATSNHTFYSNGQYVGAYTNGATIDMSQGDGNLYFSMNSASLFAQAQFDNIRVWKRTLTLDEVTALQTEETKNSGIPQNPVIYSAVTTLQGDVSSLQTATNRSRRVWSSGAMRKSSVTEVSGTCINGAQTSFDLFNALNDSTWYPAICGATNYTFIGYFGHVADPTTNGVTFTYYGSFVTSSNTIVSTNSISYDVAATNGYTGTGTNALFALPSFAVNPSIATNKQGQIRFFTGTPWGMAYSTNGFYLLGFYADLLPGY